MLFWWVEMGWTEKENGGGRVSRKEERIDGERKKTSSSLAGFRLRDAELPNFESSSALPLFLACGALVKGARERGSQESVVVGATQEKASCRTFEERDESGGMRPSGGREKKQSEIPCASRKISTPTSLLFLFLLLLRHTSPSRHRNARV
jgi:hypothetical protein